MRAHAHGMSISDVSFCRSDMAVKLDSNVLYYIGVSNNKYQVLHVGVAQNDTYTFKNLTNPLAPLVKIKVDNEGALNKLQIDGVGAQPGSVVGARQHAQEQLDKARQHARALTDLEVAGFGIEESATPFSNQLRNPWAALEA